MYKQKDLVDKKKLVFIIQHFSLRATADRNRAIGWFMKENKVVLHLPIHMNIILTYLHSVLFG